MQKIAENPPVEEKNSVVVEIPLNPKSPGVLQITKNPGSISVGLGSCLLPKDGTIDELRRNLSIARDRIDDAFYKHAPTLLDPTLSASLTDTQKQEIREEFKVALNLPKDSSIVIFYAFDPPLEKEEDRLFRKENLIVIATKETGRINAGYVIYKENEKTGKYERNLFNPCLAEADIIFDALEGPIVTDALRMLLSRFAPERNKI
jgi:hypothetical protein